jgi:hypothetical protein
MVRRFCCRTMRLVLPSERRGKCCTVFQSEFECVPDAVGIPDVELFDIDLA